MLKKNCFSCNKEVVIKYNLGKLEYSKKNDWFFWTEKEENKDRYICNSCLLDLYYNNKERYLQEVSNKKKRKTITSYIYQGVLK